MKGYFFGILLLWHGCFCFAAAPLKIGMELSNPPYEMISPDGKPCGISVDQAYELGKFLNREVKIENISYLGLVPSLKSGKIDLIISSMSITEERKKSIDFSDPYTTTGLCLLLHANSKLKNIQEGNQPIYTFVVKSGSSGEVYASKYLPHAKMRVLEKESTCILEVVQGKADAFIYDRHSVNTIWQKNPKTTKANLEPFHTEYWGIGVGKENRTLLEQVNHFIQTSKMAKAYQPHE